MAKLPYLQVFQVFQDCEIWPKLWNLVNPHQFVLEGSDWNDPNQFCRVSVWSGRLECFETITMSELVINQGRPRAARVAKKGRKTNLGFKFPLFFPCPSLSLWQSPPCRKKQQQSDIRNIRTLTRMTWLQHVMTLCCRNGINNSLQIIFSIWGGFEKTRTQIVWMKPLNKDRFCKPENELDWENIRVLDSMFLMAKQIQDSLKLSSRNANGTIICPNGNMTTTQRSTELGEY